MKLFLMSMMLAGASQWATTSLACPGHDDEGKKEKVVRVVGDCDKADAKYVVTVKDGQTVSTKSNVVQFISDDGNKNAQYVVTDKDKADNVFVMSAGANDGRSDQQRFFVRKVGDESKGGWLGVSIAGVPEALASQLDVEGRGVIIQNVVDGSPADEAGIQVHDIVLEIDGDDVDGNITRAVSLVKAREPGDEIEIIVLRDGKERNLVVELGSRSDLKDAGVDWKFEFAPDAEIEDRIKARGKMMWRSDDGKWEMKDLGDLSALKNLPESIRMFVPKSGERSVQFFNDGGHRKVRTKVQRDGNVIVIEQDGDEITVTRVEDGEESEATYDGMEDLRDGDEEAYDMLQNAKGPIGVHVDIEGIADIDLEELEGLQGLHNLHIEIPEFEFEFDSEDFKEHMGEWHTHLEESLEAAKGAHEEAMKEFHILMEKQGDDGEPAKIRKMSPHFLWKSDDGKEFRNPNNFKFFNKPKHSFKVQKDGTIEVRIRKGDTELVQLFENETDLRRRNEDLFKKYEDLMSIEDEE